MSEYTLTMHRGKWAVTFRDGTQRRRISTGTAERIRAEQIARQIWSIRNSAKTERIGDLWTAYSRDRISDGVPTEKFHVHWLALAPTFAQRIGSSVTREDCRAYYKTRKALGYSDSTIRTDLAMLRACLRHRYGQAAPSIWLPPASPPRDTWLTKAQARMIVDMAETPHAKLFVILGLSTGARAGALLDLTWDRVDFTHGTIDFRPAGRAQTNKRRVVVPMNPNAREALTEAFTGRLTDHVIEYNGKPVQSVKKAIQRLSERSGIAFSPHTLRHTAAVWMSQADVPMQKISEFLGHTSIQTTITHYSRYSPSFMRDAGEAVRF